MKVSSWLNLILGLGVLVMGWLYFTKTPSISGFTGDSSKLVDYANNWARIEQLSNDFRHRADSVSYAAFLKTAKKDQDKFVEPFSNKDLALAYITNFSKDGSTLSGLQANATSKDFTSSVWLDAGILGDFVGYAIRNHCDGVRVYFSKYTPFESDVTKPGYDALRDNANDRGKMDNRYGVIFSMTKDDGHGVQRDTSKKEMVIRNDPSTGTQFSATAYNGLYNYSNLCPPYNCPTTPPLP